MGWLGFRVSGFRGLRFTTITEAFLRGHLEL